MKPCDPTNSHARNVSPLIMSRHVPALRQEGIALTSCAGMAVRHSAEVLRGRQ